MRVRVGVGVGVEWGLGLELGSELGWGLGSGPGFGSGLASWAQAQGLAGLRVFGLGLERQGVDRLIEVHGQPLVAPPQGGRRPRARLPRRAPVNQGEARTGE